jgi:hypothetical protein
MNNISESPEALGRLAPQLDYFFLKDNPLSEATINWLDDTFLSTAVSYGSSHYGTAQQEDAHKTIIKHLYGTKGGGELIDHISQLTEKKYVIIREGRAALDVSGESVIQHFFHSVGSMDKGALKDVYGVVLEHYLDEVSSEDGPRMDAALGEMSTALGNCATPVGDHILRKALGLYEEDPKLFEHIRSFDKVIERAALQDKLQKTIKKSGVEGSEEVQGLINSIYLENAEENDRNKIKIWGERARLPSVTAYPDFSFEQVRAESIGPFVKMCCETDATGEPKMEDGHYTLDQVKLDHIKNTYLSNLKVGRITKFIALWDKKLESKSDLMAVIPFLSEDSRKALDMESNIALSRLIKEIKDEKELEKQVDALFERTIVALQGTKEYMEATSGEDETQSKSPLRQMVRSVNQRQRRDGKTGHLPSSGSRARPVSRKFM